MWTFRRTVAAVAVLAAAATLVAVAGALAAAPPMGGRADDANRPAAEPVDMSASDVGAPLTRMLLEKPAVPITLPKDQKPVVSHRDVPIEGTMVVDRLCRLSRDEKAGWWMLTFQPQAGRLPEVPRRALPCRLLEEMELAAAAAPSGMFRVSGQTTVCNYQSYLLLTKVLVVATPASAPATQPVIAPPTRPIPLEASLPAPQPRPTPGAAPAAAPPASAPASRPTTKPADKHQASSLDVLHSLLAEDVAKPVLLSTAPPPVAPARSVAPGADKPLAGGRDAMVIDRVVRILPEEVGTWWLARFESDNTLEDPPMKLLPCAHMEKAQGYEARKRPGAPTLIFRVSGIVTQYKGEQYLLLGKLIIERNMGRF
jgi:hypothetical protein